MTVNAPFVDTHVHFWDLRHPNVEYSWLQPSIQHPSLGDIEGFKVLRFSANELVGPARFHAVSKIVHVGVSTSADQTLETSWLQSMADRTGWPNGAVVRCNLAEANAARVLDRHAASRITRAVRDFGAPGSFDEPAWRQGYSLLAERNLAFCHEVGLARVEEAVRLLTEIPWVWFCVEHCMMPRSLDRSGFSAWRGGLRRLAQFPQTIIKVSALGQWGGLWTIESARPWVLECIDAFGPSRVVFGSNFPVDGLFAGYGDVVEAFRTLVAEFSVQEQRQMLAGNAEAFFRI